MGDHTHAEKLRKAVEVQACLPVLWYVFVVMWLGLIKIVRSVRLLSLFL